MRGVRNELTGKTFGRLTVIERAESGKHEESRWLCICTDGNSKIVLEKELLRGRIVSCGCYRLEIHTKHGQARKGKQEPLYKVWSELKRRCLNQECPDWPNYGGRGITVCAEWLEFEPFSEWAAKNGYRKGLLLDRRNNDRGYSPENCRWATPTTSARNTRKNKVLTAFGETKTLVEWSEDPRCKTGYHIVKQRINKLGWPPDLAISTPSLPRGRPPS